MDFEGKKVLVTGSAHGLGRQIALDFAQAGATVAIHYLHSKKDALEVAQLCTGKGKKPILLKADVTKPGAAEKLVQDAGKKMGGLDVLVNNVGTYIKKPLAQMTRQEWQGVIDSNLNATFYCTQAALPRMRKTGFGRIINIGYASCGRIEARLNTTAYAIAKTGVLVYTKSVALAEAANGITCNMVSPGNMERSVEHPLIPAGRDGRLDEVSRAVLFLAQKESAYITGQNLEVAGGYRL